LRGVAPEPSTKAIVHFDSDINIRRFCDAESRVAFCSRMREYISRMGLLDTLSIHKKYHKNKVTKNCGDAVESAEPSSKVRFVWRLRIWYTHLPAKGH
jgi:hypothetical protein